ncbi:hypothetical protein EMIHUDRAFT_435181 [Emiliania huxleyi CCMP1516]|uniref:Uncharacterized protein n=2 Tax=Emiliania huxleyi TaxID=2903 RepID=A0A0D3JQJ0_EMIH1|nr:hypothetical protein EMIHUDRAFT_435181 [Emiliania huxleyi CCMP1516]EOD25775.1 hypothetical protein EMIHUDRAFT_435181 [Emiliania huxleyi CCMP1516]|eukprot:XP_005778204.1 hypothetical protein EMIHUDRAFT_435181 [Emiliania huxleyi CCMP1516]
MTRTFGRRWRRGAAVVGVGLASGAAVALTAGLAAPAVIGGIAAVGGGISSLGTAGALLGIGVAEAGALLGTGVASIASLLSGALGRRGRGSGDVPLRRYRRRPRCGAGLAAYKMDRRLADVSEFDFLQPRKALILAAQREHDGGDGGGDGGDGGDGVRSGGGVDSEEECGALVSQRIELAPAVASVPASTASGSPEDRVALAVDSTSHPPALELSIAAADVAAAESACEGAVACRGAFPEPSRIFPL